MKLLVNNLILQTILLQGFFMNILGNTKDSDFLAEKEGALRDNRISENSITKNVQHGNPNNSSNSVTYVSTYTLPTLIWSSHHSKKLREKIRKNRSFNRVQPNKTPSETKILSKMKMNSNAFLNRVMRLAEFGDWKETLKEKDEDKIQLPIEKMFVDRNSIGQSHSLLNYENATSFSDVTGLDDNVLKVLKKKKKRKNRKRSKSTSASLYNVNTTNSTINDYDSNNALAITKKYSNDVGESRTLSLILFMNAIFVPAIILEVLTIGAFIFVSPVVGFGLLLITIVGAILTGFTFLIFI